MTLFRENPSLVRPTKIWPHSSGTATMIPVSRSKNSSVGPSYISPSE